MNIAGFQDVSLIDYPNEVASIIFTWGCNLRCPYCYNWRIILDDSHAHRYSEDEIIEYLKNNSLITAVVISGGEPTIQEDLLDFIKRIKKETSLKIKLYTNGTKAFTIFELLPYIDSITVNLKRYTYNAPEKISWFINKLDKWGGQYMIRYIITPTTDKKNVRRLKEYINPDRLEFVEAVLEDVLDPSFFHCHEET